MRGMSTRGLWRQSQAENSFVLSKVTPFDSNYSADGRRPGIIGRVKNGADLGTLVLASVID